MVTAAYDFSAARTVFDVGGGEGVLLASILWRYQTARGVLLGLDHVVASAPTKLDRATARRCNFVAGGDLYVMKNILHDWNDIHANPDSHQLREGDGPAGETVGSGGDRLRTSL